MGDMLNKVEVQAALRKAAQAPSNAMLREFDKVWARINRGEFDVEVVLDQDKTPLEILTPAVQAGVAAMDGPVIVTNWILLYECVSAETGEANGEWERTSDHGYIAGPGSVPGQLGLMQLTSREILHVADLDYDDQH